MARDVTDRMTDEELEALRRELQAQRVAVREALAEDLGGDPDDYRADRYLGARSD